MRGQQIVAILVVVGNYKRLDIKYYLFKCIRVHKVTKSETAEDTFGMLVGAVTFSRRMKGK